MEENLRVAKLIAEASSIKKKKDTELAKRRARAKVGDDIEHIDLEIGKDAEV